MSLTVPKEIFLSWITENGPAAKENLPPDRYSELVLEVTQIQGDENVLKLNARLTRIFELLKDSDELTESFSTLCKGLAENLFSAEVQIVMEAKQCLERGEYQQVLTLMLDLTEAACGSLTSWSSLDRSALSNRIMLIILRLIEIVKYSPNLTKLLVQFHSIKFIYKFDKRFDFYHEMRKTLDWESIKRIMEKVDDYVKKVNDGNFYEEHKTRLKESIAYECFGENKELAGKLTELLKEFDNMSEDDLKISGPLGPYSFPDWDPHPKQDFTTLYAEVSYDSRGHLGDKFGTLCDVFKLDAGKLRDVYGESRRCYSDTAIKKPNNKTDESLLDPKTLYILTLLIYLYIMMVVYEATSNFAGRFY